MYSNLYYDVVRSISLGLEPVYDNFKLRIINDKVCIVGFIPDFYRQNFNQAVKLIVDGSLFSFDFESIDKETHLYNCTRYKHLIRFEITLLNVETLSYDMFYQNKNNQFSNFVIKLNLPDTKELMDNSMPFPALSYLIAPNVVKINKAFLGCKSLKVLCLDSYKDTPLVFSPISLLKTIKLSKDYIITEDDIINMLGLCSSNLFILLVSTYCRCISLQSLFTVLDVNTRINLKLKNLTVINNSNYYNGNEKFLKESYTFSNVIELNASFIHCIIGTFIFEKLEHINKNTFINCFISQLCLSNVKDCEKNSFVNSKIIDLDLSNVDILNTDIFCNCSIEHLVISSNCVTDMALLKSIVENITIKEESV